MWFSSILGPTNASQRTRRSNRRPSAKLPRPRLGNVEQLETRLLLAASIWTDKLDYAPGETALINGTGYLAGETIQLQVTRTDGIPDFPHGNEPWQVVDGVGGFTPYQDAGGLWHYPDTDGLVDGNLGTSWFVEDQYAGSTLRLTATGLTSGEVARWDFTDAGAFSYDTTTGFSDTVSLNAGATNSTTLSTTITAPANNGNFNVSLSFATRGSTTIGIGSAPNQINLTSVTRAFTTSPGIGDSDNFLITVSVGASVSAGTYNFRATALESAGTINDGPRWDFSVIVTSTASSTTVVTSSANPSTYGDSVTFTATVSAPSTPTGSVTFVIGSGTPIPGTVGTTTGTTATWTYTISTLSAGSHTVQANYTPTGSFAASSGTLTGGQTVNTRALNITVAATNKTYDGTTAATVTLSDNRISGDTFTTSFNPATFSDKHVDTGKTVTVTGIAISGGASANYTLASTTATTTANITKAALTISAVANSKTYDGTTSAAATPTVTGTVVAGDTASFTESYDTKDVGTGKTLTPSGAVSDGNGGNNYSYTFVPNTTGVISAKSLTITGAAANSRVYDATAAATVDFGGATLVGVVSPDVVSIASTGYAASFADKNVGTAKPVTVTGVTLTGADAANYTVSQPSGLTAGVTARPLTVSATADNKVYNGNTTATATLSDNRVTGDALTTGYGSAAFADKHVGTGKAVSVSGITLSGTDAGNYTFNTTAATTADITTLAITGSVTAANKIYDGTTAATILTRTLSGAIGGDDVNYAGGTATFADKNVGTGKTVSATGLGLTGADAGNYTVNATAATTADITVLHITGSFTAANKTYDGTTSATVLTRSTVGDVGGVTLSGGIASFDTKSVGNGKTVTLVSATLTGADAGNYVLDSVATATANVTPRALTVSAAGDNKVYDGTTNATVTLSDDRVSGDVFTAGYTGAAFADKHVGNGKTVSVVGIGISGADADNYTANTTAMATADITARGLTITAVTNTKTYDGTTTAVATPTVAGVQTGDTVTGLAEIYTSKAAGTGKALTVSAYTVNDGNGGNNYTVTTVDDTTGVINQLALTGSITASNKVYDGTTAATIATRSLGGVVSGDVVNYVGGTATFANKVVGAGKTVTATGLSLSGADADNYSVNTTAATTADITPKALTGSFTADNKVYDGTTSATIATRALSGAVAGDDVSYTGGTASFGDKNVGDGKTVTATGLSLAGADAGNYTANTTATATADVTPRTLTVSAAGANKVYDGTTAATVNLTDDRVTGDVFTANYGSAAFVDKNASNGKTVNVTGISISGTDAGNYTFNTSAATTATITARALTVTAATNSKTYDGTTSAAATPTVTGTVVAGDTASFTESYDTKDVGTGKTLTPSGAVSDGNGGNNYSYTFVPNTTGAISAKSLTITGAAANSRVYDATAAATVDFSGASLVGVVSPDVVTIASTGYAASFADKNVGTAKPVTVTGVTLTGADAGNYTVSQPTGLTADVTPLAITGSVTADNKVYDGTTTATIATRALSGVVSGDVVNYVGGSATFGSKNVGTGKTVTATGLSLSGADAGNYSVNTTAATTADITPKALTGSITASNKVYDGTASATIATRALSGAVSGDVVNYVGGTATFADANVGTGKTVTATGLSLSGTDAGNYTVNTTAVTTADITQAVLTVTAENKSRQYSDPNPTFTYTITGFISPDTVSVVSGTPSLTTTATTDSPVGTYTITAAVDTLASANYSFSFVNGTLNVTWEDALTYYTGLTYVTTASANTTSATVVLAATVKDISAEGGDSNPGDIRTASLEFYIVETNTYVSATIGLVNPLDTTVGTATANVTLSAGSSGGTQYTIRAVLGRNGGNYTRNSTDENQVVTVSIPQPGSIGGGGFLVNVVSNGTYAGDVGTKTNFGLNVKFNKTLTKLQGSTNIIIRKAGRVYQIKSNATDTLTITNKDENNNTLPAGQLRALFTSKANLTDITNPLAPLPISGGHSLQITLTDKGEPGSADQIAITLIENNTGNLLYSSRWNGTKTVEQTLGGGNLQIRQALQLAGATGTAVAGLTQDQLQPVVEAAKEVWRATGLSDEQVRILDGLTVQVDSLPGGDLGWQNADTIVVDQDAAGHGWFIDPTPFDDAEFTLGAAGLARGRVDLLSVVAHEIGHALGFDHDHDDEHAVMGASLAVGVRTVHTADHDGPPDVATFDAALASSVLATPDAWQAKASALGYPAPGRGRQAVSRTADAGAAPIRTTTGLDAPATRPGTTGSIDFTADPFADDLQEYFRSNRPGN